MQAARDGFMEAATPDDEAAWHLVSNMMSWTM
jgi:hypothetical protein